MKRIDRIPPDGWVSKLRDILGESDSATWEDVLIAARRAARLAARVSRNYVKQQDRLVGSLEEHPPLHSDEHGDWKAADNGISAELQRVQRALGNCYMMSKREIARIMNGKAQCDATSLERWRHVHRFCEGGGEKSSILRAALPTEITDGEVAPGDGRAKELGEWLNAEWAVAPKNGERFALGQRDKNGAIQNAYTTGARDVIHRLSCRLEELTTQAEAGDGRAARMQAEIADRISRVIHVYCNRFNHDAIMRDIEKELAAILWDQPALSQFDRLGRQVARCSHETETPARHEPTGKDDCGSDDASSDGAGS